MEFRNHPIIEGLRINEDGTEIYYNKDLLRPFENDKKRENPTLKVNFLSKAHSVTKLVCEAWNGMSEHSAQRASKINLTAGNHYSNLEWKEGATNGVGNFKQKIKNSEIDNILELMETNKKSVNAIAGVYGVNTSTIYRIKERYGKKN